MLSHTNIFSRKVCYIADYKNVMRKLKDDFFDGKKPKGSSSEKTDLSANVIDNKISLIKHWEMH